MYRVSIFATYYLDGSIFSCILRKFLITGVVIDNENFFALHPDFHDKVPLHFVSHQKLYEETIRKATLIFSEAKLLLQEQGKYDTKNYVHFLDSLLGTGLIREGNPLRIHFVMFIPAIIGHADSEQQERWLEKALNCNIIGTYAQTELGHGTYLRGLETTATFDESTDEIVINSPTLSSFKWWPGALAQTVNYCIVMAQLYSRGKCHGIHPFLVQVRDESTHMPLPGLEIGDIGDKLGYKGVNNGYLGFTNFRIPRTSMMMKNARLLRDGTYVKPASSVLAYGTMVFVRVVIVREMAQYLAKAATIAVRYSCVRRQSLINPDQPEVQVIDHLTQQNKLLPQIAKAVALKLTAENLWRMYERMRQDSDVGSLERLPELHAVACCLKAISSADAAVGIEVCRLACGGHGYLSSANFMNLYSVAAAASTYEGENTVLLLQTSRYLIKAWNNALQGQSLTPTISYLGEYAGKMKKRFPWSDSTPVIISAFRSVVGNRLSQAWEHIEQRKASGYSLEEASNMTGLELVRVAEIHGRWFVLQSSYELIENTCRTASPELSRVLQELCKLLVYHEALKLVGDLLRFTTMSERDLVRLQEKYEMSLAAVRPESIGIVDSFDYPDFILGSALGAHDGNVYERLFEEAMKSPLNQEPVNKTFAMYLKPLMKSNLCHQKPISAEIRERNRSGSARERKSNLQTSAGLESGRTS
ncbi:probable peroxisomal acyl-coenzyme A oxidase 1 isoform X2 [Toxorhynchites rutilus septentrionalis]|uniref:probable peroxisomal acyl-coenzyme A oxidase 1 isoform X2 n=1 Tax=Toxorhynchites rutilus septentrionalis TaxID=329112 RepID=UPI00247A2C12|nr:probable peroxisomal acyl-coenzyme A oxidase 1 isoform X2 [Toxorhynchites rutilus septentrionalis]